MFRRTDDCVVRSMGRKSHLVGAADRARRLKMSSSVTLIPATIATVPNARGDIARGFKLARRWQQQGKWREAEEVYRSILTVEPKHFSSEERRVGKECRSRWSPYH